ncbi:MAG: phospholipase D-like domain-containing protein [Acidimicrobiales bacterium]
MRHSRLAVRLLVAGAALVAAVTTIVVTAPSAEAAGARVVAVWTEPRAGYGFVDAAIAGARHSIDLSMYELTDPTIIAGLETAQRRGVRVRVILDRAYHGGDENQDAYAALSHGGVTVRWAPATTIYHAKYMVVDSARAYVGTGNFTSQWYTTTRDFWVEDTSPADVRAIERVFTADVTGRLVRVTNTASLVWSPGAEGYLEGLINRAHHSLLIETEEMYSYGIEDALVVAAQRGVRVTLVMTRSTSDASDLAYLASHGVHVVEVPTSRLYIHAKVICVDCIGGRGTAFVGSQNFSTASLDYNRELGVVTNDPLVVRAIDTTVRTDARR